MVAPQPLIATDALSMAHMAVRCYFCGGELMENGYRIARVGQEAVIACLPVCTVARDLKAPIRKEDG
jgi:hypothetical protein